MALKKSQQLSPKDWELISAYLDDQLSLRQCRQLEARLDRDPGWQAALEEMRQTRLILRTAPQLRAPRSFILTPEIARQKQAIRNRIYPVLQLTSAIASLAFVLVVVGDIFRVGQVLTPAPDLAVPQIVIVSENEITSQEEVALEMAADIIRPEAELAPEETLGIAAEQFPEGEAPQAFSLEVAGDEADADRPQPKAEPPENMAGEASGAAIAEDSEVEFDAAVEPIDRSASTLGEADAEKSVAESSNQAEAEPCLEEEPLTLETHPPSPRDGEGLSTDSQEPDPEISTDSRSQPVIPLIRWLEILLGFVALIAGFGAYWLKSRK
jgi:anti-sigma factor RsiW